MEYIKKEELIIGEIYNCANIHGIKYIVKIPNDLYNSTNINKGIPRLYKMGNFTTETLQWSLATPEEKHWLNECIKLDKFITFEEVMKTFIPEYVECTENRIGSDYIKDKIYKVKENGYIEGGFGLLINNKNRFKPSTKEAYDAQFVVKEPEFVLPEKWCLKITKENLDFCKSLENNELKFHKNYPYSIGGYYSPIPNKDCNGFINIPENYTEITFEQFKQFVLKEEIVEKVIEPLPQFKVIETIETITKVENNEGNQFFIGDTVKSLDSNQKGTITKFRYSADKSNIIAITTFQSNNGIGIDKIEHYIEPKVEFFNQVMGSDVCFDMATVAKVCNLGIGRNTMFAKLRDLKILQYNNAPYQQYIDKGYFRVVENSYQKPDGSINITVKTVVYQKGVDYIIKTLSKFKK